MAFRDYFSLRNAVRDSDPVGQVAAGLAQFEREHGYIPKDGTPLVWDSDGRIQKTPLL